MEDGPIMRADDGERTQTVAFTKAQRRVMRWLAAIQVAMIVLTWMLLFVQILTNIHVGIGAAPTFLVFVVVYLHFTKSAVALADMGIRVRWISAMRVVNPILYSIACVLCVCTLQ